MKQNYTITVADMEMNVISEAPSEDIEKIVGILDRRIRSIILKSKNCSKTDATLLCALEFCADKLQMKDALETLMGDLDDEKEKNAVLAEKLALLEKNIEKTEKECSRLQAENKRLMFNGQVFSHTPAEPEPEKKPEPAPVEKTEDTPPTSRNRVGGMFDLLTFTDI